MKSILNHLLELHIHTKSEWAHKDGLYGLAQRMYVHEYELSRVGKTEKIQTRKDISSGMILKTYLARKIFVNEKFLRNGYPNIEVYNKELEFTTGLWELFCTMVFGKLQPELKVVDTYKELKDILNNKSFYSSFDSYNVANDVVVYYNLNDFEDINNFVKFDAILSMPENFTRHTKARRRNDRRRERDEHLIMLAMGMYRLDYQKFPSPYINFWKSNAELALKKIYAVNERFLLTKFRNAEMYNRKIARPWPRIESFNFW